MREAAVTVKDEFFKGKMQKNPRKLYKTTALLDLEVSSPQCKSPELQEMLGP